MNELTRIVVTTRNDNPSIEEYDAVVSPEWKRCQEALASVQAGSAPTLAQLRGVLTSVVRILRVKHVPEPEIRERVDEAFARSRQAGAAFDRAAIESGAWEATRRPGGGR